VKSDVAKYVAGCDVYQRVKHGSKGKAPLEKNDIPKQPFQRIQIDFVGPVQVSVPEGFTYVLAIQDVLTRYVKLVTASDNSAETAVRVLIDEWITQLDISEVIGSDQGPHFTATVFEATCKKLGIEHALGSPEHPQSKARVEQQNKLFANIRAVCNRNPSSWPRAMHAVTFAHNTSVTDPPGYHHTNWFSNNKRDDRKHSSYLKILPA
jgi:transposase InsO family protein